MKNFVNKHKRLVGAIAGAAIGAGIALATGSPLTIFYAGFGAAAGHGTARIINTFIEYKEWDKKFTEMVEKPLIEPIIKKMEAAERQLYGIGYVPSMKERNKYPKVLEKEEKRLNNLNKLIFSEVVYKISGKDDVSNIQNKIALEERNLKKILNSNDPNEIKIIDDDVAGSIRSRIFSYISEKAGSDTELIKELYNGSKKLADQNPALQSYMKNELSKLTNVRSR